MMRTVEIAGGGIAGLALGLALRRNGVPVQVYEAGIYPRHRLCGEFLSGVGPDEIDQLALTDVLAGAPRLTDAAWIVHDRIVLHRPLPQPALGISRWKLDAAMAARLVQNGGEVKCGARVPDEPRAAGRVVATGRPRAGHGEWWAQKAHFAGLAMHADLEMHLGRDAYAGVARVENGLANVCALLPASAGKRPDASFPGRLRDCGLASLAKRLESAEAVPASNCGVSWFRTGWQRGPDGVLSIGDQRAIIAPFTGHGMAMAMLSALEAAPCLTGWSQRLLSWDDTIRRVRTALRRKFRWRLRWASWLHPLLYCPAAQSVAGLLARRGLVPWRWLYQKLR